MDFTKYISTAVERQFPSLYREEADDFVQLIKEYYQFLEQETLKNSTYYSRLMFELNDIDRTLEDFIEYFKTKYLDSIPYQTNTDKRFIIKHILDLYQRKGSEESVRLLFRLLYNRGIEIYYPSVDILKPSASIWTEESYIELYPNNIDYQETSPVNKIVVGSISGAEGYVSNAIYRLVNNNLIPILFLENVSGTFSRNEGIFSKGSNTYYGKLYGSLSGVTDINTSVFNNKVGDIVTIQNPLNITTAKGVIKEVNNQLDDSIRFSIEDPGFGYTTNNSVIYISNQILFFAQDTNTNLSFNLGETVENENATASGIVVYQESNFVAIQTNDDFESSNTVITTRGTDEVQYDILSVTEKNGSASFGSFEIDGAENIEIFNDLLKDYANVTLNAADYGMTGEGIQNKNTILSEAFEPDSYTIGSIATLNGINEGGNYTNRVYAYIEDSIISNFNKKDQIVILTNPEPFITIGDEVTQNNAKGIVRRIEGNELYISRKSFEDFFDSLPLNFNGIELDIVDVKDDENSKILGASSFIVGNIINQVGSIGAIDIISSGYGYINDSDLTIYDSSQQIIASAKAVVESQGKSEGIWKSKTSHIGVQDGKVLQDSFFYQDYSYEIGSSLNINTYEDIVKDLVHPAGVKLFGKNVINERIAVPINVSLDILSVRQVENILLVTEDGNNYIVTENTELFIEITREVANNAS